MNTDVLEAGDDEAIDEAIDSVRQIKVKVSTLEEGEAVAVTVEVPFISPEIRATMDNMLFVSCYGHKAMFAACLLPVVSISRILP